MHIEHFYRSVSKNKYGEVTWNCIDNTTTVNDKLHRNRWHSTIIKKNISSSKRAQYWNIQQINNYDTRVKLVMCSIHARAHRIGHKNNFDV